MRVDPPGSEGRQEARKRPEASGAATSEEMAMIKEYVLLPYMLAMVERSKAELGQSRDVMKQLYERAAEVLLNRISEDCYRIRAELNRRNIRLLGDEQVDQIVYHRFICRGYENKVGIVRKVMRSEIGLRLGRYYSELGRRMEDYGRRAAAEGIDPAPLAVEAPSSSVSDPML